MPVLSNTFSGATARTGSISFPLAAGQRPVRSLMHRVTVMRLSVRSRHVVTRTLCTRSLRRDEHSLCGVVNISGKLPCANRKPGLRLRTSRARVSFLVRGRRSVGQARDSFRRPDLRIVWQPYLASGVAGGSQRRGCYDAVAPVTHLEAIKTVEDSSFRFALSTHYAVACLISII